MREREERKEAIEGEGEAESQRNAESEKRKLESGTPSLPKRTLGPLRLSDEGEGDAGAVCRGPPTRRAMPRWTGSLEAGGSREGAGAARSLGLKFSFLKVSSAYIKVSF